MLKSQLTFVLLLFAGAAVGHSRSFEFRYVLETEEAGEAIAVNPASGFDAGDRLRIRVLVSQESYCYLAVGRSDGRFELIPGRWVAAGRATELPELTWLHFDRNPGVEMLYLIVTSRRVRAIEELRLLGTVAESSLLKIRARYQTDVTSERDTGKEWVRIRQKAADARPFVILEPIRLRHR